MMKRIIAAVLLLATVLCAVVTSGCSTNLENEDKGQCLTMYLADEIYNLDPANAYYNQSTLSVVSLLFDTLFTLDSNGKIQYSLAKKYEIEENPNTDEYYMYITLRSDACWSDGSTVTADDVVYAWKRLLTDSDSYDAACLLYDIKNARLAKAGDKSIDDVQIYGDNQLLTIRFEKPIDYNQFLLNLTSVALAPLKSTAVDKGDDWSKKGTNITCNGPFKISKISVAESGRKVDKNGIVSDSASTTLTYTDEGYLVASKEKGKKPTATGEAKECKEYMITSFVLERNAYYYRNKEKDSIKKSVTPYKLVFDASLTTDELLAAYNDGSLLYIGDIPLALRETLKSDAEISDSMTVNQLYFNLNADIAAKGDKTEKLFAKAEVRQALSLAIDRTAIAEAAVFAEAATGLVPNKVYMTGSAKTTFRDACTATYEYLATDMAKAKELLSSAKVTPSNYTFTLSYAAYDDVQSKTAEAIYEAWKELGFKVTLKPLGAVKNQDYYYYTEETPNDICDDMYEKAFHEGNFEVILIDSTALTPDPFSVLAPYAKAFCGSGLTLIRDEEEVTTSEDEEEETTLAYTLPIQTGEANYIETPHITGYDSEEYNQLIEKIFAEKNISARKDLYLQAEAILMNDLPVVPVIAYQSAYVMSSKLKGTSDNSYYNTISMKKASLSAGNYEDYIEKVDSFVNSIYEENSKKKTSYFYTFNGKSLEEFKDETSIYSFVTDYLKALTATQPEKKK